MSGKSLSKLQRNPIVRWSVALLFAALVFYQAWALKMDMPRMSLFDRVTPIPSWLVITVTHVAGIATLYAIATLIRGKRDFTECLIAVGMCAVAMGRFADDKILDQLAAGKTEPYPVKFFIATVFLVFGIGYQLVSRGKASEETATA